MVRRAGFDAFGALPPGERVCAEHIEHAFLTGGTAPPRPEEVVGGDARRELGAAYPPPAQFTVSQARERLRSTRRFIVPLLEFLDASRFTRRAGDLRSFVRQ